MQSDKTPIIVEPASKGSDDDRWEPNVGPEILDFLDNLENVPINSREKVRDDAAFILSKGINPIAAAGQETGLVVGYVQSGKTISFEAVAALARDNDFQIVIVVAGRSISLLEQSTGRLRRDLRIDEPDRPRNWFLFKNPSNDDGIIQAISGVLDNWRDSRMPKSYKKTVLITVLKQHQHLRKLTTLIRALNMKKVPVLIIDDEADQASLNTKVAERDESTTYRRLMELRQELPNHTYLQYTATPQAPLLISIIDSLSPNFVQVLEPGDTYVGGQEFFADNRYIRIIPPKDVPRRSKPLIEPPETLLEALRVFLLGVTTGLFAEQGKGNRSMLVHPSHRTAQHRQFYNWVRNIIDEWKRILDSDDDPDKRELIEDFRDAYVDLAKTAGSDLPAFDDLTPNLPLAFGSTLVWEINASSGSTPQVDWRDSYGWILIGGQAMDRGFTVEGLTVTYMPRSIGGGNADTVQQRARFFGYKRSYLSYCRLYLEQGKLNAFQSYVDHEEYIREQLENFQQTGRPLNEWKRAFVLDTALKPCRSQVLEFDYMRGLISDDWVSPNIVLASNDVVQDNRETVDAFVSILNFVDDEGHPDRTDTQCHEVCREVPLRDAIKQLLVRMRINDIADSQRNTGMLLQLSLAQENNPNEVCTVYRMSPRTGRSRKINGELFQGKSRVRPEVYLGDRAIRDQDTVTIQIHMLALKQGSKEIKKDVPVIAVWVPKRLARPWIIQDQPVQDGS